MKKLILITVCSLIMAVSSDVFACTRCHNLGRVTLTADHFSGNIVTPVQPKIWLGISMEISMLSQQSQRPIIPIPDRFGWE